MATRKCRHIYFPKCFMAVRKFTNICITKYFCTSVNINEMVGSRIHYSSFASYVMCYYCIKKAINADRLNVA